VGPQADEFAPKMMVLENVEHHAEEEESEMFPKLRSGMDTGALDALAERLEERKSQLGAPVLADKIDLTDDELKRLATEQEQIPGLSKMFNDELAATVAPA
jgi:hypothetical protein